MIKEDSINEFIKLRIQGLSFDKITEEIGVSKPTLISWSKKPEISDTISDMKAIETAAMLERYKATHRYRVERLSTLSEKLTKELDNRDLTTIPTDKLLSILLKVSEALKVEDKQQKVRKRHDSSVVFDMPISEFNV